MDIEDSEIIWCKEGFTGIVFTKNLVEAYVDVEYIPPFHIILN